MTQQQQPLTPSLHPAVLPPASPLDDAFAPPQPEVVAPGVVQRLNDTLAAPSDGTGVSGNLTGVQLEPPPPANP